MGYIPKRYGLLDRIQDPAELKEMSYQNLVSLCESLREFMLDHISQTGGHLSSNLGAVELCVALERELDTKRDRLIFDVGHQSYVHKILTGRKEQFHTLRTYGGISGFPRPKESIADACIAGHASNSVSVALGMAHARTIEQKDYHVVAVIGDGALTGGMAYEALNNAGASREPLLVILNDNNMSIAKNVGAVSRHLAYLRVKPRYLHFKKKTKAMLSCIPGGKALIRFLTKLKSGIKSVLLPSSMFEQMGFHYLGPVDGHDIKAVCEVIHLAKTLKEPTLIHVMTQKGRGYLYAEQSPDKYHGVQPFDLSTGLPLEKSSHNFSQEFGQELVRLAANDPKLCAVTAAMGSGTGLSKFSNAYPKRFFDVGIAEEHAVAMTAGMAKQGLHPVCPIYSTFLQRAYDQLIHDVAIDKIDAVFPIDRAGIVGEDGATHNGVFDVGFIRQIPGFTLLAPSNYAELRSMLKRAVYEIHGPVAVRYPRGSEGDFKQDTSKEAAVKILDGRDIVLVSYGILINQALDAAQLLLQKGIHASVFKINELTAEDWPELFSEISRLRRFAVIEDVIPEGGIGEAILAAVSQKGISIHTALLLNSGKQFLPHGSVKELYHLCQIDSEGIAAAVLGEIKSGD